MTHEIYRPRLSNGVVKFAEIIGTVTSNITVDAYMAIPVYSDAAPDRNACSVELNGYRARHNTYLIHPLTNNHPLRLDQKFGLYITDEQSGLNIFLQEETINTVKHLYLCADSRVLRKVILTHDNQGVDIVSTELWPAQDVMIEREDILSSETKHVVLPSASLVY